MDQNFNPYTAPPLRRSIIKPNYFEMFALGFAIASLFSCTVIYIAYMFAGFAILFALLSRGAQMKMSSKAKWSVIIGIAGIILATVVFVVSFLYLLEEYGSIEAILQEGSEIIGIDFEEEFGHLFK